MMKLINLALIASAAAQEPQLSSENGKLVARSTNGLEVERRQTVDGFALSQIVQEQATTISVMQSTINVLTGSSSPLAMVQGIANDVATRTNDLLLKASRNEQMVQSLSATVARSDSTIGAMSTSVASSLSSTVADLRGDVQSSLAAALTSVDQNISRAMAQSTSSMTALNRTIGSQIAAGTTVSMWSGGCSQSAYPRGNGWREYCLDQVHIDHTRSKFRVETNRGTYQGFSNNEGVDGRPSRFRALARGYYHIQFWTIVRSHNWSNCRIYVNNQHKHDGHYRTASWPEWGNNWKDTHASLYWPMNANSMFWVKIYAHPGHWYSYHSTNSGGSHSRITVVYKAGEFPN